MLILKFIEYDRHVFVLANVLSHVNKIGEWVVKHGVFITFHKHREGGHNTKMRVSDQIQHPHKTNIEIIVGVVQKSLENFCRILKNVYLIRKNVFYERIYIYLFVLLRLYKQM